MKTKEELIAEYLAKPLQIGDIVTVRGLGSQDKVNWGQSTKVVKIFEDGSILIKESGYRDSVRVKPEDFKKNSMYIGYNPINPKPHNSSVKTVAFGLESILHSIGFERAKREGKLNIDGLNWNPTIIDKSGKEVGYQRDFVWSLEDKQLLIESIYNNIDIGKIVVRNRPYDYVEARAKAGLPAYYKDIVDGKQRLNCIIEFCSNVFPDLHGRYWRDFSDIAKGKFLNFSVLSYGEMGEKSSDEDVKKVFLAVNFTGVEMSQEHIDYVKSLDL